MMALLQCSNCDAVGDDADHCPFFLEAREPHEDAQLGAAPTHAALNQREREWCAAHYSEMRIRAYNINGERIGVAGVGEGDQRLTFPAKLRVETVLSFHHWIKEAPPGSQKWYVPMGDWRPKAVIFGGREDGCPRRPYRHEGEDSDDRRHRDHQRGR